MPLFWTTQLAALYDTSGRKVFPTCLPSVSPNSTAFGSRACESFDGDMCLARAVCVSVKGSACSVDTREREGVGDCIVLLDGKMSKM